MIEWCFKPLSALSLSCHSDSSHSNVFPEFHSAVALECLAKRHSKGKKNPPPPPKKKKKKLIRENNNNENEGHKGLGTLT